MTRRFKYLTRPALGLIILMLLSFSLGAQDGGIDEDALFGGSSGESDATGGDGSSLEDDLFGGSSGSEDDLFGGDSMIEELPEPGQGSEDGESDAFVEFLTSDEVQIGGSLSSSLSSNWAWANAWDGDFQISENEELLGISLGGSVFLNARPSRDLRIYMRARTSYPFDVNSEIFEFYSDVNWNERLFFRFGKQTVNWGVGYFYSPADFISLVPIDIDDPEADREGPVAIKATLPLGLNEFDAYVIGDESVRKLEDLGFAGRATFFLPPVELAVGAGYQQDRPFRLMSTLRFPWRDWNFFAEGRVSFGRQGKVITDIGDPGDLTAVIPVLPTPPTFAEDDELYLAATGGFLYLKSDLFESSVDVNVIAQYYYQGEGYDSPDFLEAINYGVFVSGDLDSSVLTNTGQHYSVLSLGVSQLLVDDLSISGLWQANWSDFSGLVNGSVSYRLFDGMSLSLGLTGAYGDDPSEFRTIGGNPTVKNPFGDLTASISVNLGGGRF